MKTDPKAAMMAKIKAAKSRGAGKSMSPGGGGRFAALTQKLSQQPGVTNPAGLAASIGRKKYGAGPFQAMADKDRDGM